MAPAMKASPKPKITAVRKVSTSLVRPTPKKAPPKKDISGRS